MVVHPLHMVPSLPEAYSATLVDFFVDAFTKTVGWGYPLEAELASILHAILFAFYRGWHSLCVESDSILAIHTLLKCIQIVPWRIQGLWSKTQMAHPYMYITYSHILREGNQATDSLAKLHSDERCNATILTSIRETDQLALGLFSGSVRELLILGRLGFSGRPSPPTSTIVIRWRPPQAGWYKVNVDGSVPISPGPLFAGAIFRNSRGFFVAALSKPMGWGYPSRRNYHPSFMLSFLPLTGAGILFGWNLTPLWPFTLFNTVFRLYPDGCKGFGRKLS
ncbi:hypothetical protein ACS0TY_024362 [Phlomoides rotata]